MNQSVEQTAILKQDTIDFPALITVICHLMTCYALRPSEPLAVNISRHMTVLLNSTAADTLKEWRPTFRQLQRQWLILAERHAQHQLQVAIDEAKQNLAH